jgi:hypothetical protein
MCDMCGVLMELWVGMACLICWCSLPLLLDLPNPPPPAPAPCAHTQVRTEIPKLVAASLYVFTSVTSRLRPTPAKSHYTFNLRDLSKVFQGMAQCPAEAITKKEQVGKARAARCQGPCAPCANPNPPPPNKRSSLFWSGVSNRSVCGASSFIVPRRVLCTLQGTRCCGGALALSVTVHFVFSVWPPTLFPFPPRICS